MKAPGRLKWIDLKKEGERYEQAFMRRDIAECRQIVAKILKANPKHIEARLMQARLMGVMCRFKESFAMFSNIINQAPSEKKQLIAMHAARMASDFYDPTVSLRLYQQAIDSSSTPDIRVMYAEHMVRMRNHAGALEQVRKILHDDKNHAQAILLDAKLETQDPQRKESLLRDLATTNHASPKIKILANYDLAKHLDQIGDYEGAMKCLLQAKSGLQEGSSKLLADRKFNRAGFESFGSNLTPTITREWRSQRFKPISGIEKMGMIVGHPRSGTTLLEQIIDSHPMTQSAEETENFITMALLPSIGSKTNILDGGVLKALQDIQPHQIEAARKEYRASIGRAISIHKNTSLLVDKNPSLSPNIGHFIRFFPETKIVAMIRDPRDVVLSCFFQPMLPINPVSSTWLDLEEAAAEYAAVMRGYELSASALEDAVMELRYEDLVDNVEPFAKKVTSFLGQPWDESVLNFHERAREKIVRSPTADAVTEKVHQRAKQRWRNYERYLEPCMKHLEPFLKHWNYS